VKFKLPGIYPITDVRISGLSHLEQVIRLIDGGATLIQLREKFQSPKDWFDDALAATEYAQRHGCKVIINDRVDIALAVDADGVHVGQTDMPPAAVRRLVGDKKIIGYSTHNEEQFAAALLEPVDHVAYGPIFGTSTKIDPDETTGTAKLAALTAAANTMPVVVIGGISAENLQMLNGRGISSVAIISAILSEPDKIAANFRKLSALFKQKC